MVPRWVAGCWLVWCDQRGASPAVAGRLQAAGRLVTCRAVWRVRVAGVVRSASASAAQAVDEMM
jgi:hypothetical protein